MACIGYLLQNGAPDLATVSGPQLHTRAVIEGLRRRGHEVRIVAIQRGSLVASTDAGGWYPPRASVRRRSAPDFLESAVRRVQSELRLPFLGLFDSLRFGRACVECLNGCDLLYERHGYLGYGGLFAARRLGVPHVLELNGNIVKEVDEIGVPMSRVQRGIGRSITARTLRETDHVVVVSDALRAAVTGSMGIAADKVSTVLNGVDFDLFAAPRDRSAVCERFGIRARQVVVFTGSFQPWHGVELLVEAFGLVRQSFPDVHLMLVGDGVGRSAVERALESSGFQGSVSLLGKLEQVDVADILSVADVLVAPYPFLHSDIVGTPLKLLEYMAAGRPVVASTAPIHEIVRDGVTGLRIAPADPRALADGIGRVLASPPLAESLGAHAREAARDYSWTAVVERLCKLFAQVCPRFTGQNGETNRVAVRGTQGIVE
jgi:glycosyltransferase involved in cell wall biosynthesis